MANYRQQFLDRCLLEQWREILPGVPDDLIVIPRYCAGSYGFPPPPHGRNQPEIWDRIGWLLSQLVPRYFNRGRGRAKHIRNNARTVWNIFRKAERWWKSLGEPTPLLLNQKLYVHRNRWKNIFDFYEFLVCHSLCLAWLNLPSDERSVGAARLQVRAILRERLKIAIDAKPPPDAEPNP